MIARIWHGWTTVDNADAYQALLETEIFPGIEAKGVAGYLGIDLLRRPIRAGEVEFITVMWFDSWDAVRAFGGKTTKRPTSPTRRGACWRGSTPARHTTR